MIDSPSPFLTWLGLCLGLAGGLAISAYTVANRRARSLGAFRHWLVGWILALGGMASMLAGWVLLCLAGPRWESLSARIAGGVICFLSAWIYVQSARLVGRWRRPSSYTLSLCTRGIHARIRHPQALSLCILVAGLVLLSGSIPFLVTSPLWIAFWAGYTVLEERAELIPTFGEEYHRYRKSTPRLIPRIRRARSDKGPKPA